MLTRILIVLPFISRISGINQTDRGGQLIQNGDRLDTDTDIGKFPCGPKSAIAFEANFDAVIQLPQDISTTSFLLPENGGLVLHLDNVIRLFNRGDSRCKSNRISRPISRPKTIDWFDPKNWRTIDSFRASPVPDIEKIPCNGHKIGISIRGATSINLENVNTLVVSDLRINNRDMEAADLEAFFKTDLGQFMFKGTEGTKVFSETKAICGCHDVTEAVEYQYRVCSHRTEPCPIPNCINPIVPIGSCCAICGAVLKLHITDCSKFDRTPIDQFVDKLQTKAPFKNNVLGYGSVVQEGYDKFYQFIAVDRNVYNEVSVQFIRELQKRLTAYRHDSQYSGRYYASNGGSSFWTLVFSSLFAVLAFFFVIYAYYERDVLSYIPLPGWLNLDRYRVFRSPFVFARFENHPADVDVPGNVAVAMGHGNHGIRDDDNEQLSTGTTSFHNPMFSEKEIKSGESSSMPDVGEPSPRDDKDRTVEKLASRE